MASIITINSFVHVIYILYFSDLNDLYHPMIHDTHDPDVVSSLNHLARVLERYDLCVGWVDRKSTRFLDVHCYCSDESDDSS